MATTLDLGGLTIHWLGGGAFHLDGGAMFGPVPKSLWAPRYPADNDNLIHLVNAPLLVRTGGRNLVIDTGLGNRLTEKQRTIFRVECPWNLVDDLARLGLAREDIDTVILTHCDFDHAGGVVMRDPDNRDRLTFPRARHLVQAREWEDVTHPNSRAIHTYWPENFAGLAESGLLEIVDGEYEAAPGVTLRLCGGHTRGFQLVEMRGDQGCAVHLGDLFPTHVHANPLWVMAYDNFPLEVVELKERLLPRYRERGCWFTFYHDPFMAACRLDREGRPGETLTWEADEWQV